MSKRELVIQNSAGIHARPAALIVKVASGFSCQIILHEENGACCDPHNILELISMGAGPGTRLVLETIEKDGSQDAQEALRILGNLIESNFEEAYR